MMEQESALFQRYRQAHRLLYLPLAAETIDIVPVTEADDMAPRIPAAVEEAEPQEAGSARRKRSRRKRRRSQPTTPGLPEVTLEVDPATIDFGIVPVWDDVEFCYRDTRARDVRLVGDFTQWTRQPVPMVWDGEAFRTSLALADGRYLYRFQVDGRDVVDPQNPSRLAITAHGFASVRHVQRWQRTVRVVNHRETPMTLSWRFEQPWLRVTPPALTLDGLAATDLCLELQRADLTPGAYEGRVELLSSLQGEPEATVTVRVQLRQHGLVLRPLQNTIDIGPGVRGERRLVPLAFEVLGDEAAAKLPAVRIYNHETAQLHTVQLDPAPDQASGPYQCLVPVDLGALPRVEQGNCRLSIDTQCYLWNRRFHEVTLHYQLLFLKKRPPRLHFRRFGPEGAQRLTLHVARSDGQQPDVDIALPHTFDGRLKARRVARDTWQFEASQNDFATGERVEGVMRLTDRREPGCTDQVRVIVEA